jgi:hypothetical protein
MASKHNKQLIAVFSNGSMCRLSQTACSLGEDAAENRKGQVVFHEGKKASMQDRDQYIHFTIKLLKGSFALNALWQDALSYHMIDQPDKLIAMRLTEYYELIARGALRPGPSMVGVAPTPIPGPGGRNSSPVPPPTPTSRLPESQPQAVPPGKPGDEIVASASSSSIEQNADDAADYWTPM